MANPIEYPPPDPDGRPHIWHDFETPNQPEVDLGRSVGSAHSQPTVDLTVVRI
jgi:hypothetical protein